jgi:hypothetical protein
VGAPKRHGNNKDARISDRAMELLAIYKQDMPNAKCSPNRKSNIAKARKAQPLIITPFFLLWQGSPACIRKLFR